MSKIFTKTGDRGETGLFDGTRVPKNDPRIEVVGTIDECNATLGVVRSFNADPSLDQILKQLQSQLLLAGSPTSVTPADIQALEDLIDHHEAELPALTHFILPAGGQVSAHLHLARTLSRRVERRLADLGKQADPLLQAYFNRLSDTLFVLARHAAHRAGKGDEKFLP